MTSIYRWFKFVFLTSKPVLKKNHNLSTYSCYYSLCRLERLETLCYLYLLYNFSKKHYFSNQNILNTRLSEQTKMANTFWYKNLTTAGLRNQFLTWHFLSDTAMTVSILTAKLGLLPRRPANEVINPCWLFLKFQNTCIFLLEYIKKIHVVSSVYKRHTFTFIQYYIALLFINIPHDS